MKVKKINNLQISDDNLLRYNKHILLDEIDLEGIESRVTAGVPGGLEDRHGAVAEFR